MARAHQVPAAKIGQVTTTKEAVFMYEDKKIAAIPHQLPDNFVQ